MKLSIITINLNNQVGLQKTIESVINQTFKDFEFLVIDGGSTDGSINVIENNSSRFNYWVSEKDKGVYHAMNKGIRKANGEYLLMLNSGDVLSDTSILWQVFEGKDYCEDVLYGSICWENKGQFYANGNFPRHLTFEFFWVKSIAHQAAFIKRTTHNIVGLYDEKMKISGDWKFFVLAFRQYYLSFRHLPFTISKGDINGLSWDSQNFATINKEQDETIKLYFNNDYNAYKKSQPKMSPSIKNHLRIIKNRVQRIFKLTFN